VSFDAEKPILQVVTNEEATVLLLQGGELHVFTDFGHKRVYCNARRFPKGMFVDRREEFEIIKLATETDHGSKFAAISSAGEIYAWTRQTVPHLVWPLKNPGYRATGVSFCASPRFPHCFLGVG